MLNAYLTWEIALRPLNHQLSSQQYGQHLLDLKFLKAVIFLKISQSTGLVQIMSIISIHSEYILLLGFPGDHYCDDVLNNAECLFDMGDCSSSSGPPTLLPTVWTTPAGPEVPEGCVVPPLGIPPPPQWLGKV